jgi:two-component system NtrC family sensor kinase
MAHELLNVAIAMVRSAVRWSRLPPRFSRAATAAHLRLLAWMLAAVGAVTSLAWWDARRESEALFRDVGQEQFLLASVVALDLQARLENRVERNGRGDPASLASLEAGTGLLRDFARLEHPGELRLFVQPPGIPEASSHSGPVLYGSDGGGVASAPLADGLRRNEATRRLDRADAAAVGLVLRTAMAGFAHVDAGPLGLWGIVAVGTAARPRDREARAFWRLALGVAVAAGLVLAFGGVALRTQRRELEAQRELAVAEAERVSDDQLARAERMATMGTFAIGVVHEVSTPLGVIVGRAEQLCARAGDDARSARAVEAILGQVDRIQIVVRRFLDLARGGPPSLERTRPGDVVRAAAASVEHRFAKAGVDLVVDADDSAGEILCDRALLEQALVNLLLNACDACAHSHAPANQEPAPATGIVEIANRADAERMAFVVADDGDGIDPAVAARVTEPFFTTKAKGAGTGLGLAIASEIAKSHRGTLALAPNAPRGTRACIEIPILV